MNRKIVLKWRKSVLKWRKSVLKFERVENRGEWELLEILISYNSKNK